MHRLLVLLLLLGLATPAAAELPEAVIRMIQEAHRSNDDAAIAAVVRIARRAYPDDAVEIDRLAAGDAAVVQMVRRDERRAEEARIRAAGFLDIWKGEVELGGSYSTGLADVLGLYASANLTRDQLEWRQQLRGRVDIQRTDGTTTTERGLLSYQPNYKFRPNTFIFGIAQYEHDRFLGYTDRYTAGLGLGRDLADNATLRATIEGGPAVRVTRFVGEGDRTTLAARASATIRWTLAPNLVFNQDVSAFLEKANSTATATASLDTRLVGALKARFSYNIVYEDDAQGTNQALATLTRATLVYGF